MTPKETGQKFWIRKHIPVTQEHERLRTLAVKLCRLAPTDDDIKQLATDLDKIGLGEDANKVFGVSGHRGRGLAKEAARFKSNWAVTWVVAAMAPVDQGGLGWTRQFAIVKAAENFGIDADNLSRYVTDAGEDLVNPDLEFSMTQIRPRRN